MDPIWDPYEVHSCIFAAFAVNKTPMTVVKCPRCRKETTYEGNSFRPFCSERCRLIDLGSWADGSYRIPLAHDLPNESENENSNSEEEQTDNES